MVGCALVAGVGMLIFCLLQTPIYRAAATLYVTSGVDVNSESAYQSSLASQQRVTSYTQLVTAEPVIADALKTSGLDLTPSQAQQMLSASALPESVILTVVADGPDRDVAAKLVNADAEALTRYVQKLESPKGSRSPLATLTVVNPAVVSSSPVSPKTTRNVLLGGLIGLAVGFGIVLVRRHFDNRIRSTQDITDLTDRPVLTAIPTSSSLRKAPIIDFRSGSSAPAEAFRKLRSGLGFVSLDHPARIVMVTSANAGDGKTTTVLNLAASLAEAGSRVVLVDTDLRRPALATHLGLSGDVGLTNVLRNDTDLDGVLQTATLPSGHRVTVLASGATPPNPSELLGLRTTGALIESLGRQFDYVIMDSTPVIPITDATVAAQWADGVLLVVRANTTRVSDIEAVTDELGSARVNLLGVVMNGVSLPRTRAPGYYQKA